MPPYVSSLPIARNLGDYGHPPLEIRRSNPGHYPFDKTFLESPLDQFPCVQSLIDHQVQQQVNLVVATVRHAMVLLGMIPQLSIILEASILVLVRHVAAVIQVTLHRGLVIQELVL